MEQIRNFPVFASVQTDLANSHHSARNVIIFRIQAARKKAKEIIETCFGGNEALKKILKTRAFNPNIGHDSYSILADQIEIAPMRLLEWVLCLAIEQAQDPDGGAPIRLLVGVMKRDLEEETGYTPGNRFNVEFEEIKLKTNGFISILPHNSSTRTDRFVFSFLCDFTKNFEKK